jgi:hypothetical protein
MEHSVNISGGYVSVNVMLRRAEELAGKRKKVEEK